MRKNYIFPLLFLLFSFIGFSQTNLISNGDFENWTGNEPDNWTTTVGAVTRNQSDVSSGSSSTQIFNATTSQDASIQSDGYNLIGGKTYLLRLDVKMTFINGSSTNDNPSINIRVNRDNGSAMGFSDWHQTDTWEAVQIAFEAPANDVYTFDFNIATSSIRSLVQDILIDNVRLFDASEVPENIDDRNALIALYNATDGSNWQNTWDLNQSIIYWDGITQNDNGRVTKIKLRANNLIGFLPAEIGDLEELQILDLTKTGFTGQLPNNISGIIPPEIGNLTKLKDIYLSSFELSGNIPPEMGQMEQLESLFLSYNNLTGSIPTQFGNLTNLKILGLNSNELTGAIPTEFGQLDGLLTLNLEDNDLSGPIPATVGQMTNISYMDIGRNNLTGGVPAELGQLQNLKTLDLGQNNLGGPIPTQLGQLSSIENLYIDRNGLTGSIPKELGQLTSLLRLGAESNSLEGEIPVEIGSMTNLTSLNLGFNQLSGSIPSSLGQLTNLVTLFLRRNNLSGNIPIELAQIPTLNRVQLDRNNLSGVVPTFPNSHSILALYTNSFVFEDLKNTSSNQPNMGYTPQENIGDIETISVEEGQEFSISVDNTTDEDNTYQWRKNDVDIAGATNPTFSIQNTIPDDAGQYDCLINNTVLTSLELTKNQITLVITNGDDDNDGVTNNLDQCPNTPSGETVDTNGCSQSQLDDDNDGVTNNLDQCPNTPLGVVVDNQGCLVMDPTQTNYLQNFSFEDWSGNPQTPDNWTITNANSIIRNTEATDDTYSLEIDLNNSLQFKTELQNTTTIQLATNTTYTYSFDYKIKRGDNVSAEIQISKDGNPFGIRIAEEFIGFESDGAWHTVSFEFDTNDVDEEHIFKLVIRANTAETGIILLDNMRVLGESLPDADGDGILDANDQCPNTSPNAIAVDDNGCEVVIDNSNILEDPSFEDWSFGGGSNLAKWGINLIPGSSWIKNLDVSDNLEYSLELTTGDNGSNASSIFQNDIQLYKGVEYIISIDYKVLEGSFNALEFELSEDIFADPVMEFSINPLESGWTTYSTTYTPLRNEIVDLRIGVVSDQQQERILLDNTVIRPNIASTDDDNDGVDNTIDQCPNTPISETVDTNGCSQSQLDDDNDGVNNNLDNCPNTPLGETVDVNGCATGQTEIPLINNNDIEVQVVSTSCPDKANGAINVSFNKDYNYVVNLSGEANETYQNVIFSSGLSVTDLMPGTYTICISIPEYPSFERCFSVVVDIPEAFISGKAVIDNTKKVAKLVVSGSKNYEVVINDKVLTYSFDDTGIHELAFNLNDGVNTILAKTDKYCQGEFQETYVLNNVMVSPNPTNSEEANIFGLLNTENATINISDSGGALLKTFNLSIENGSIKLPITDLPTGLYYINIKSKEQDVQTKMIKR